MRTSCFCRQEGVDFIIQSKTSRRSARSLSLPYKPSLAKLSLLMVKPCIELDMRCEGALKLVLLLFALKSPFPKHIMSLCVVSVSESPSLSCSCARFPVILLLLIMMRRLHQESPFDINKYSSLPTGRGCADRLPSFVKHCRAS